MAGRLDEAERQGLQVLYRGCEQELVAGTGYGAQLKANEGQALIPLSPHHQIIPSVSVDHSGDGISIIAAKTYVVTNGHAGYNDTSLGKRTHDPVMQTKAERRENDAVQ